MQSSASAEYRGVRLTLIMLAPLFIASAAGAQQWTVVNLHPAGLGSSQALDVSDGQQGGSGGYWTGTAESYVSLGGNVYGVGDGQQVGRFVSGAALHACVWTGTAESRVDLHPAGAILSEARGAHGGMQSGFVGVAPHGAPHAVLWAGSAASMVDLHPAGSTSSQAFGIHAGQQVGQARFSTGVMSRAALWNGTAATFVDLHPGVGMYSIATGTDGAQQVGSLQVGTDNQGLPIYHAALWSGSAASFLDLNPAGVGNSGARAVANGEQVGFVNVDTITSPARATLWTGTAASAVDLHALLPPDFTNSAAHGIWHDGPFTYVVGNGQNSTTDRMEALLWIRCNGSLAGDLDTDGDVDLADLARLLASFGCAPPETCDADIDGDGDVDLADLGFMLANFGEVCP